MAWLGENVSFITISGDYGNSDPGKHSQCYGAFPRWKYQGGLIMHPLLYIL